MPTQPTFDARDFDGTRRTVNTINPNGQALAADSQPVVIPTAQVTAIADAIDTKTRAAAVPVSGPVTDAQLRASAVPVSGPVTDAQLRAAAVPVSGPVTDAQLRAAAVPVSGPLTDTQLRATPVPVSGPATDAQIRAVPVPTTFQSRNLIPDFTDSGWTRSAQITTWTPDYADGPIPGTRSVRMVNSMSPDNVGLQFQKAISGRTDGRLFCVSLYVRGTGTMYLELLTWPASGSQVGTAFAGRSPVLTGSWKRIFAMGPSIISNGTILTVRIKGLTASSPIDCEIVAIMTEVDVSAPSPFIPSDAASEGVATIPPLPQSTCTMIAWGDSLTAGSGGKWVDILAASLAGNSIVNKGVGGETSTQIATRMAAANYAELNRGIVIIWVGRNNFLSPATVLADLETMAALVPHGRFLVLGITNQTTEVVGGSNYNAIRALNAQIAMRFGRRYLDVRKLICQGSVGDSPRACWMSDATHMNQAGYGLIAAAIRDAIIANGFLDGQPIQKIAPEVTLPWQYQGAITTASTTVIKAATAEAWATVNGLQFINANGTATDISVQDTGGNILWVSKATANMPQPFGQKFDPPLMATQIGYGIQVVTSAAGDVRFNAQGDLQAGRI